MPFFSIEILKITQKKVSTKGIRKYKIKRITIDCMKKGIEVKRVYKMYI